MRYEKTASRIREAMKDLNMSQQELADKSGIGKSSISHYVNGANEPGNKSAYSIAQALKVNPAWIMGIDAPKHENIPQNNDPEVIAKAIELYSRYENLPPEMQKEFQDYLAFLQSKSARNQ